MAAANEQYLRRIKRLASNVLRTLSSFRDSADAVDGNKATADDLRELVALLQRSSPEKRWSVWLHVGTGSLAGLVALFAAAVRGSGCEAFWSLRAALAAHLEQLLLDRKTYPPEETVMVFETVSEALLRTQALQCYTILLADLSVQLSSSSAPRLPPRHAAAAAGLDLLREALVLVEVLLHADDFMPRSHNRQHMAECSLAGCGLLEHWARALLLLLPAVSQCEDSPTQDAAARLLPHMALALRNFRLPHAVHCPLKGNYSLSYLLTSHLVGLAAALDGGTTYGMPTAGPGAGAGAGWLLADTAGLRLHLRSCAERPRHVDTEWAQWALRQWCNCLDDVRGCLRPEDARGPRAGSLRRAGRELLPELRWWLTVLDAVSAAEKDERSETLRSIKLIEEEMLPGLAVPPFKVAATLDVSMRLAGSAVAALEERLVGADSAAAAAVQELQPQAPAEAEQATAGASAAAGASQQPQQQPQQQQRPRVPPDQAVPLGLQALKCARAALWDLGGAPEVEHPPQKLEQLRRWWELAVRLARAAAALELDWAADGGSSSFNYSDYDNESGGAWDGFKALLQLRSDGDGTGVASCSTATADVGAALRAGYPQLMELLLRRSVTGALWAGMRHTTYRSRACYNPWAGMKSNTWAQLLAFTDPRVTASLLATVAKAARWAALQMDAAMADMASSSRAGTSSSYREVGWLGRTEPARDALDVLHAVDRVLHVGGTDAASLVDYLAPAARAETATSGFEPAATDGPEPPSLLLLQQQQQKQCSGHSDGRNGRDARVAQFEWAAAALGYKAEMQVGALTRAAGAAAAAWAGVERAARSAADAAMSAAAAAGEAAREAVRVVEQADAAAQSASRATILPTAEAAAAAAAEAAAQAVVEAMARAAASADRSAAGAAEAAAAAEAEAKARAAAEAATRAAAAAADRARAASEVAARVAAEVEARVAARAAARSNGTAGRDEDAAGGGDVGGNGHGGPQPVEETKAFGAKLARALSCMAVQVLPAAARLTASLECVEYGDGGGRLLAWVPLLAAAAAAAAARAVVTVAASFCTAARESEGSAGRQERRAAAATAAADWDRLLWVDIDVAALLDRGLSRISIGGGDNSSLVEPWLAALRALAHLAPRRLAEALRLGSLHVGDGPATRGSAATAAAAGPASVAQGTAEWPNHTRRHSLSMCRLRKVLGPGGHLRDPALLALLESVCKGGIGVGTASTAGGSYRGAKSEPEPRSLPAEVGQWLAAAALLVAPGEVRALLPCCDNPGCTNLEGDSEAGLRLAGCGRCGGRVRYCSRACQTAHWKGGHKAQCAGSKAVAIQPARG